MYKGETGDEKEKDRNMDEGSDRMLSGGAVAWRLWEEDGRAEY